MNQIVMTQHQLVPLPPARIGEQGLSGGAGEALIAIRPGMPADLPFIDALQKKHGKQLGFMNRPTLEGKIAAGHVLVAEATENGGIAPAGYLIGNDRYRHRDELGVIFQMCVVPAYRRSLVAANLLKAQFERSAYGCKLYCCWCAQDIEANRFWESMGFVPIAFRAGSEKRNRVHLFWQRRIRDGDTETPWWFPSETTGGLMDASRIALPIPTGMHWGDELPRLIPTAAPAAGEIDGREDAEIAPSKRAKSPARTKRETPPPQPVITGIRSGGLRLSPEVFAPPGPTAPVETALATKPAKPKRVKKAAPELAARARELRDRWMEAAGRGELVALPAAKYDIGRRLPDPVSVGGGSMVIENAVLP